MAREPTGADELAAPQKESRLPSWGPALEIPSEEDHMTRLPTAQDAPDGLEAPPPGHHFVGVREDGRVISATSAVSEWVDSDGQVYRETPDDRAQGSRASAPVMRWRAQLARSATVRLQRRSTARPPAQRRRGAEARPRARHRGSTPGRRPSLGHRSRRRRGTRRIACAHARPPRELRERLRDRLEELAALGPEVRR